MLSIGICHKCPSSLFVDFLGVNFHSEGVEQLFSPAPPTCDYEFPLVASRCGVRVEACCIYFKFENKSPFLEVHTRQIFRCQVIAVETTPIFEYLDGFKITKTIPKSLFSVGCGGNTPATERMVIHGAPVRCMIRLKPNRKAGAITVFRFKVDDWMQKYLLKG